MNFRVISTWNFLEKINISSIDIYNILRRVIALNQQNNIHHYTKHYKPYIKYTIHIYIHKFPIYSITSLHTYPIHNTIYNISQIPIYTIPYTLCITSLYTQLNISIYTLQYTLYQISYLLYIAVFCLESRFKRLFPFIVSLPSEQFYSDIHF